MPNIDDVVDQLRLVVETCPSNVAGVVRIVFEREELQILHAGMLAQI
jgi:hypothetical protein